MDANMIVSVVSSLGFPIVCCGCLFWYVKYISDNNNKEVAEMRKEHKEEVAKMTDALNNNTLAIQRLTDKLEKED